MLGEPGAAYRNLTHPFVNTSMVISLSTLIALPGGNVLDDDKGFAMPEVLASPLCLQMPFAAERANLSIHV
jgi:hypothetical protein